MVDADTAAVLQVFASLTGQPIDRRIAAWEGWLAANPGSAYAVAVRADLDVLRAQRAAVSPRRPTPGQSPIRLAHQAPTRTVAGRDVPLVFVIDDPAEVLSAWLHYRVSGAPTYTRVLLAREHDVYLRATIPAAVVAAPGVEYFVEGTVPSGESGAAYARPDRPAIVEVARPPVADAFAETRKRTRLSMMASYLDFANLDDRAGDHTDRFYLGEVDVLYRLGEVIYGVRAGYGTYAGRGGLANHAWTTTDRPPVVGFQYGYAETELRLPVRGGPSFGIAGRVYAGVGEEGFGLGLAGRLRVGHPDGTNLSAGASAIEQIGFYSDLRLEAWPRDELPIGISVGVTDQPGSGDLGVRLAADVGWRALSWLQPTLRLSWQGRTAVHYGLGGGLGLVFDW